MMREDRLEHWLMLLFLSVDSFGKIGLHPVKKILKKILLLKSKDFFFFFENFE